VLFEKGDGTRVEVRSTSTRSTPTRVFISKDQNFEVLRGAEGQIHVYMPQGWRIFRPDIQGWYVLTEQNVLTAVTTEESPMIDDATLAQEIVNRLNALVMSNPEIRTDIGKLIDTRIAVSEATAGHPTIQAIPIQEKEKSVYGLGFLGLLNGIVGVIPQGRLFGLGYIAAVYDEAGSLVRFRLTETPKIA
jgi:hypothetical protein